MIFLFISASLATPHVAKRGVFDGGNSFNSFDGNGWNSAAGASGFGAAPAPSSYVISFISFRVMFPTLGIFQKSYHAPVSSAEIASAIQAAKEASGNVAAAQRRVQEAKNEVLQQQHLASQKQSDAALALQVSKHQSLSYSEFYSN